MRFSGSEYGGTSDAVKAWESLVLNVRRGHLLAMTKPPPRLHVDVVDPLSYLFHRELQAVEESTGIPVERVPVELRPPPCELTDGDDPFWRPRWDEAVAVAAERGLTLERPELVPWSRKAHELLLHARASGADDGGRALDAILAAFFVERDDIGRVDVLVRIGQSLGLDLTETKAVLDVDRYEADVCDILERAHAEGTARPPVLTTPSGLLQGFHNQAAIGTFLAAT